MKSNFLQFCLIGICSLFISCNSDDDASAASPNTPAASEQGFFYAENASTVFTKTDDVKSYAQWKTVIAQNSGSTVVEMVLPNLQPGTYSLATAYAFSYRKNGATWEATAGSVTISENDGTHLSGTFEATAGSGVSGVDSVKGHFNEVPIE